MGAMARDGKNLSVYVVFSLGQALIRAARCLTRSASINRVWYCVLLSRSKQRRHLLRVLIQLGQSRLRSMRESWITCDRE
jgi:hypothetical protein